MCLAPSGTRSSRRSAERTGPGLARSTTSWEKATVTHIPSMALKSVTLEGGLADPLVQITFINGISLCAARPCVPARAVG